MKRRLTLCLTLCSMAAFSQTATITGQAVDYAGSVLTNATVLLVKVNGDTSQRKTTLQKTNFSFRNLSKGKYSVTISYTELRDTTLFVNIQKADSSYNLGRVQLQTKEQLDEVVVKAVIPPMSFKNDTTVYNADSYKTPPYASVESLLKLLPGMELDEQGDIIFNGEKVKKIYIDGKEFFLNDPVFIRKNFYADMVDKVEAFDEKSERKIRTGMAEATTTKAINLKLKPGKNSGVLGTATATGATGNRFGAGTNVTSFGTKHNYVTGIDFNKGVNLFDGSISLPNTRKRNATINYGTEVNSKLNFSFGYTGSSNSNAGKNTSERQTFFPDSSLLQTRTGNTASDMVSHSANFNLQYKINSYHQLKLGANFSYTNNENSTSELAESFIERDGPSQLLNQSQNRNAQGSSSILASMMLDYSRTFSKRGRFFQASIKPGLNVSNGDGELYSITQFFNQQPGAPENLTRNQRSTQKGRSNMLSASVSYAEPLTEKTAMNIKYTYDQTDSYDDRLALNFDETSGKYDSPDSLATNYLTNDNGSHHLSLGYNYTSNKLKYELGASVQNSTMANTNTAQAMNNISQHMTNLFPRASLMYNGSNQKIFQFTYQGSTRQPSIEQLQPTPDYSNPLIVRKGNPDLKQSFNNVATISYRAVRLRTGVGFISNLNFRTTINEIASSSITTAGGIQEIQALNTNGNYTITATNTYNFTLFKSKNKLNTSIGSGVGYTKGLSFVNGVANKKRSTTFTPILKLNYAAGKKLISSVRGALNYSHTTYSLPGSRANTVLNHNYSADINYQVVEGIQFNTNVTMQLNRSTPRLGGRDFTVWNMWASKLLLKNKGELKFSACDILNNSRGITQKATDNYIERVESEVVKRVFVLSFIYRFRKFGA